jgi:hypothetical protein
VAHFTTWVGPRVLRPLSLHAHFGDSGVWLLVLDQDQAPRRVRREGVRHAWSQFPSIRTLAKWF